MTDLAAIVDTLRLGRNLQLEPRQAMNAGDELAAILDATEMLTELERDIAQALDTIDPDSPDNPRVLGAEGGLSVIMARFDALRSQLNEVRTILVEYGALSEGDHESDPIIFLRFLLPAS